MPKNKKITFSWAIIIVFIILLVFIIYYFIIGKQQFAQNTSHKYGVCRPILSSPITDSNYIKVEVLLKGELVSISEFKWNDSDYVSNPGCFNLNSNQTVHTLSNYMNNPITSLSIPFKLVLRTQKNDNDCDFSIKVHNLRGKLIGKYPANAETVKLQIPFIGDPKMLEEIIKLSY